MERLKMGFPTASMVELPELEYQYILHRKFILNYYRNRAIGFDWAGCVGDARIFRMVEPLDQAISDLGWVDIGPEKFIAWEQHFKYFDEDDEAQALRESRERAIRDNQDMEISEKKARLHDRADRKEELVAARKVLMSMGKVQKRLKVKNKSKQKKGSIGTCTQKPHTPPKIVVTGAGVQKPQSKSNGWQELSHGETKAARKKRLELSRNVDKLESILDSLTL
ncbi:hypothetical protein B0T14DRAFT_200376 [Immersiella caudata]|uniref:Uncharacterized protein n=1 Tax=Immersiella caudata TaxID=314043 RepID=A0AA39WPA5_9PEZI|nr:hypothetical protein B0T14DRAFT_200376 [Immersiella caudata]